MLSQKKSVWVKPLAAICTLMLLMQPMSVMAAAETVETPAAQAQEETAPALDDMKKVSGPQSAGQLETEAPQEKSEGGQASKPAEKNPVEELKATEVEDTNEPKDLGEENKRAEDANASGEAAETVEAAEDAQLEEEPEAAGLQKSILVEAEAGESYDIAVSGTAFVLNPETEYTITFLSSQWELEDLCALTYEQEKEEGPVAGAPVTITSVTEASVTFTVNREVPEGMIWSGVLNVFRMKALATGELAVAASSTMDQEQLEESLPEILAQEKIPAPEELPAEEAPVTEEPVTEPETLPEEDRAEKPEKPSPEEAVAKPEEQSETEEEAATQRPPQAPENKPQEDLPAPEEQKEEKDSSAGTGDREKDGRPQSETKVGNHATAPKRFKIDAEEAK